MVGKMAQNNKSVTDEKVSEAEKNTETKTSEELFRIPKNIRQIGKEETKRKLYIEDYVLNLMKQLSKRSSMDYQMAVLLGKAVHSDGVLYLFVKGAVEVHKLTLDACDNFTGDTWSGIYSQVKQHFHDVDIVGWFLTKPGLRESPDMRLTRIHERNFQDKKNDDEKGNGENRCLLLYDSIENRENYFIYDHNRFKKAHGYYIYYERNQDMQEYLISHNSNLSIENGFEDVAVRKIRQAMLKDSQSLEKEERAEGKRCRETVIVNKNETKDGEKKEAEKKPFAGTGKVRTAVIALVIMLFCILAAKSNLGESRDVWNGGGKESKDGTENVDSKKEGDSTNGWVFKEDGEEDNKDVFNRENSGPTGLPEIAILPNSDNTGIDGDEGDEDGFGSDEAEGEDTEENGENGENGDSEENEGESGEGNKEADEASGNEETSGNEEASGNEEDAGNEGGKGSGEDESGEDKRYYTVKEGDTLASISLKEYHTILRASEIQKLNDIEDPDLIYTGQTLIIP